MDVITFQIEQIKKLFAGKALAVPDLSVFFTLAVAEAIVISQIAIPAAIGAYEVAKEKGWIK